MKNTNLYNLQNGIAILLAANQYRRADKLKASPNMEKGSDGTWYYKNRSKYMLYNNSSMVPTLVYYTELQWIYASQYNRTLTYKDAVQIKFSDAADAIECLRNGNYDKGEVMSSNLTFLYYTKTAPWNYDEYHPTIGGGSTTWNDSSSPYYVYLSNEAYSYGHGTYNTRYVLQKLLNQWEDN